MTEVGTLCGNQHSINALMMVKYKINVMYAYNKFKIMSFFS